MGDIRHVRVELLVDSDCALRVHLATISARHLRFARPAGHV